MPKYHPPVTHYDRSTIQPIDFMESSFTKEEYRGFLKEQVIKYISRYLYKDKPMDDLEKGQQYLNWLIEVEKKWATKETKNGAQSHS